MTGVKVIAFDAYRTVFDTSNVPREEVRAYLDCCVDRPWRPQRVPVGWHAMPALADSAEGIRRLRNKFTVVAFSNGPPDAIADASSNAGIEWDDVTPLEEFRAYKPDPMAYMAVCKIHDAKPTEVLMVTANPTFGPFPFGDIEMAKMLGMQAQLIRNPGCPQTIIELAESLGC